VRRTFLQIPRFGSAVDDARRETWIMKAVSLLPSATEIVFALGAQDLLLRS
jgi:hypothetical protein